MAPPRSPRRVGPCGRALLRLLPPAVVLAVLALLAPEWSGGAVIELGELNDDPEGRRLVASRDLHGGLLVIDQDLRGNDRRLVARLAPDEPEGNALLVADLYLADPHRHARPMTDDDWLAAPS